MAPLPPRLLASTHFQELLRPEVLAPSPQIEFYTMQVRAGELAGHVLLGWGTGCGSARHSAVDQPRCHCWFGPGCD
jgi:hypothetical protein